MEPIRPVSDDERRHRLGTRHALAHLYRVPTLLDAAKAAVFLPARRQPLTMAAWTRMLDPVSDDVDYAFSNTSLIRHPGPAKKVVAMPMSLIPPMTIGVTRRRLPAVHASIVRAAAKAGVRNPDDWVDEGLQALSRVIEDGPLTQAGIKYRAPELSLSYHKGVGTAWESKVNLAPKMLRLAELEGRVIRIKRPYSYTAPPLDAWMSGFHLFEPWSGKSEAEGLAELARRWLYAFGPGTPEDFAHWSRGTVAGARQAFVDVGARPVRLENAPYSALGWLLADDYEPVETPGWWVSLVPFGDPIFSGWASDDFLLGEHAQALKEAAKRAGGAALVNGRVVGTWGYDERGRVRVRPMEQLGAWAARALEKEANRLFRHLLGTDTIPRRMAEAMRG